MVQVGYRTLNFSEHNFRGNKKKTRWGSSTLRATIYLPYLPRICTRYTQVYYCRKALWFVATEGRSVLAAPVFSTKRRGCRTKNNKNYSGTHGKNYRPVMFRNHPCARHFACILSRLCLWKSWVLKQDRTPPRSRNALLYPPPPSPPLLLSASKYVSRSFFVGCSSPFMRFTEHLTALRARCKRCLSGLWKTRRAPSRHRRGARV